MAWGRENQDAKDTRSRRRARRTQNGVRPLLFAPGVRVRVLMAKANNILYGLL